MSDEFDDPAVTRTKHQNPLLGDAALAQVELPNLQIAVRRIAGKDARETRTFDGDVCSIGSHPSNDLVLDDPTVSRFHCRITRSTDGCAWLITDTGSKNGTRLDGVKVLAAELERESVLVLGESAIRVKPVSRGHVSLISAPSPV